MQPPSAYGFGEGVGFDAQLGRDSNGALACIQLALCLLNHAARQNSGSTGHTWCEKAFDAKVAVQPDGSFDGDLGYAKGAAELGLCGSGGDVQLCCDVSKGGSLVFVVAEDGHARVKVGHRLLNSGKTQCGGDLGGSAWK